MTLYKHTQIGYLMLVVTLAVLVLFAWTHMTALAEPPSVDSGTNFAVTATMALILFFLVSFATLTVSIDENYLRIKFGFGIFARMFPIKEIASVQAVKNRWYYGISGFDAVEIIMRNGKIYRIRTNTPNELEAAIKRAINV